MRYNNLTFGIIIVAVFVAALIGIYLQRDTSDPEVLSAKDFLKLAIPAK